MQILVETEVPNWASSLFKVTVNGKTIAERLTAAQAHLLVGEVIERFVLPGKPAPANRSTPAVG